MLSTQEYSKRIIKRTIKKIDIFVILQKEKFKKLSQIKIKKITLCDTMEKLYHLLELRGICNLNLAFKLINGKKIKSKKNLNS